jgi:hypothetical protein
MNTMQDGDCTGCRYASPTISSKNESLLFECLRYPPTLFYIDGDFVNVFPDAIRRCGEYRKPREEELKGISEMLSMMRRGAIEGREGKNDGSSTHPSSS